jgi:hypothetical protein
MSSAPSLHSALTTCADRRSVGFRDATTGPLSMTNEERFPSSTKNSQRSVPANKNFREIRSSRSNWRELRRSLEITKATAPTVLL